MKRIYIAGKITGLDRQEYIRRFLHAENMLIYQEIPQLRMEGL